MEGIAIMGLSLAEGVVVLLLMAVILGRWRWAEPPEEEETAAERQTPPLRKAA